MDGILAWPATAVPRLKLAGEFPLADRDFATTYCGPAHALHLHGYAGRMRLGDTEFRLAPGDLTLSPAGVASAYDLTAAGRHWCVHFHPAAAGTTTVALPLRLRLGAGASFAGERLAAIARWFARDGDPLAAARAAVALQDLLLWSAAREAAARRDDAKADAIADRAAAILDARFADPPSAAVLARDVGRSPAYVAAAFRARFGMTAPRYVLRRRMAHAQLLLETTGLPVGVIGRRVGIDDPHYFNKLVRRLLGRSPTAIRRRTS